MTKRMILMLIATTVVLTGLGFFKTWQIQTALAEAASFRMPPEAVTTIVAEREVWPTTLAAIGTVEAVHGVTVAADLPGIVDQIAFESGKTVRQGEVLLKLDSRQERAQLAAAEARRDLARQQLDRIRGLREKGVVSQSELDHAVAEHSEAEAKVGEIRATIERKEIRAPFTGILGIRQVDLGQFLSGGDPVVPLQSLHPIYVNFTVPQGALGSLGTGTEVRVTVEGQGGIGRTGRINAIDSVVDPATRNVEVQALFDNPDGRLRPGMFVEAKVLVGAGETVVTLPASSISYAPYGDSVFLVEELQGDGGTSYLGVRQQFVKLAGARGDQVAVASGVEPGAEVVTSGVFKLRNGAAVVVNNEVQPGNDPAPRPENS